LRNVEGIYEVRGILDHAMTGTNSANMKYLVEFADLSGEDSWESFGNLRGARETVERYHTHNNLGPPVWDGKRKVGKRRKKPLRGLCFLLYWGLKTLEAGALKRFRV
jgi:hypothetical protein